MLAPWYDGPGSWQSVTHLRLSSFRYERIESGMDVQERLDWLAKHDATALRFTPQPYVQLANVLRRQGFAGDAARVLVRREDKQRLQEYLDGRAAHKQSRDHLNGDLRPAAASLWADGKYVLNVLKFAVGYQMDVRIWAPARAGVALDRRYLGDHHLVCPANPHPRAVCADLLGRLDLAGLAGQFPNGAPPPLIAALARADGRLGADHIRARLYKLQRLSLCARSVYPAGCFGTGKKLGALSRTGRLGRFGPPAALACANGRLGDYRHRRGGSHRVDRSAGLTFPALRVMGEPC